MEELTVKQVAALKGCSEQHIRSQISTGRLVFREAEDKSNNFKQYLIPVNSLDPRLQQKYYSQIAGEIAPMAPVMKAAKTIEQYSQTEREEISFWSKLLLEWQGYRCDPAHRCKTEVDAQFVAMMKLKQPDLALSEKTLYRKWKAYKEGDLDGLIDKRGQWRTGQYEMPELLWSAFLWYYLDQRKFPIAKCVEYVEAWARELHPELVPDIPSYHSFYRRVQSIEQPVQVLGRDGEKAYADRCAPYIARLYDDLESNDYWVADNHTFDFIAQTDEENRQHRLYLTAFLDARSGIFTGYHVTDTPCSDATLLALRKGILKYGIPRNIYVDNGREFLCHDVGGLGHRRRKNAEAEQLPPPIFQRLGIEMTNALVCNAKAKIIERTFGDLKNGLSRLVETYTGGNVLEKPGNLKDKIRSGRIPMDSRIRELVDDMIEGYFNLQEYNGKVVADGGKRRIDVFNERLVTRRVATADDLALMMMRTTRPQEVGRRGVHITIAGERLDFFNEQILWKQGEKVYVRYDPEDLREVKQSIQSVGKHALLKAKYSQEQKAITTIALVAESAKNLALSANQSTQLLNDAIGGNIWIRKTDDPNEILIMDSADPEAVVKLWRWNLNGLGYSNDCVGVDNPARTYKIAMTMDGAINADFITTGTLLADRIVGGTLRLTGTSGTFLIVGTVDRQRFFIGSDEYDDPFLTVYDSDNNPVQTLNKRGLKMGQALIAPYRTPTSYGIGRFA